MIKISVPEQSFSVAATLLEIDFDWVLLFLGCWRVRLIRFGGDGVDSDGEGVMTEWVRVRQEGGIAVMKVQLCIEEWRGGNCPTAVTRIHLYF